jgi:hypothetical protein
MLKASTAIMPTHMLMPAHMLRKSSAIMPTHMLKASTAIMPSDTRIKTPFTGLKNVTCK